MNLLLPLIMLCSQVSYPQFTLAPNAKGVYQIPLSNGTKQVGRLHIPGGQKGMDASRWLVDKPTGGFFKLVMLIRGYSLERLNQESQFVGTGWTSPEETAVHLNLDWGQGTLGISTWVQLEKKVEGFPVSPNEVWRKVESKFSFKETIHGDHKRIDLSLLTASLDLSEGAPRQRSIGWIECAGDMDTHLVVLTALQSLGRVQSSVDWKHRKPVYELMPAPVGWEEKK